MESLVTTAGSTPIQDNDYAWRSDGTLESRTDYVGTPQHETFTYDALDRLQEAKTYLSGSLSRTLSTAYDRLGKITSKTPDVPGGGAGTRYQHRPAAT